MLLEMETSPSVSPAKGATKGDDIDPESRKERKEKSRGQKFLRKVRFLPPLCMVFLWYFAHGFNGITMQSYTKRVRAHADHADRILVNVSIVSAITAMQLLLGAVLGNGVLMVVIRKATKESSETRKSALLSQETIVSVLYGLGSSATNLGFMYGSSSLVQTLKLLEPFETLGLSQLLTPEQGGFTFGVISSMIVVVGATVSLIRVRSEIPNPHSVFFALFSGTALSLRTVLLRKSFKGRYAKAMCTDNQQQNQHEKIERSLIEFVAISYRSGLLMGVIALALSPLAAPQRHALQFLNWKAVAWHPLYNVISILVLGFSSQLHHDLMNGGTRVCAVLVALVWFREDVSSATIAGLLAAVVGSAWYTLESKGQRISGGFMKVFVAAILLVVLIDYQNFVKRKETMFFAKL